ncbi:probable splicing factor, arginine/serine-rich 7 isoform X2 [Orussus abietinus]|uniref:probable splicing factor, arginine/serine-rich 7 isoform X2 n=1 Tax=Orussus abietinus TaxID=222816 RepID=UPI000626C5A0|nr:probable splicing factor, arginine/serine-rich 7 isoform X2 [Orussus abietinus]
MAVGSTKVVQVTNIAPQATKDQMQTLFGYLGKIEDIRLYPTIRDVAVPVQSRICYIKFHDQGCVAVAQHMTNTVFIDRALIVIPYQNGDIPDEQRALELTNNGTVVLGLYPSEPKLPPNVVNAIEGIPPNHVIATVDPKLDANGLPQYPHLPGHLDSRRIEEIRRTLVVANLETSVSAEQLLDFFGNNNIEIKYLRLCTRDSDTDHYALVELSEQPSVVPALQLNGKTLADKPIKIYHSTQAIAKPEAKSNEAAQKEIEEAMSRVKEAHNLISAAIDPMIGMLSKDKRSRSGSRGRRSRSRSRGRRRSRSRKRSRSRHRRSRSRHRRRSRSRSKRSRSKDRRRKSPSRRRSSSRGRHRSRSRSRRSRSRRSRSKSKDRKKKSSPKRKSRSRSRSKRSKSKSRRSRSKSKTRSSKAKYEKSKDKDKEKEKDRRSKDKADSNGKKGESEKEKDKEKSEKKSTKEKREKEAKADDKSRGGSDYSESSKEKTESES